MDISAENFKLEEKAFFKKTNSYTYFCTLWDKNKYLNYPN